MNAAAIALIEVVVCGEDGWQARCLSEKRARKRRARGTPSLQRALRRERIIESSEMIAKAGSGSRSEGAIMTNL